MKITIDTKEDSSEEIKKIIGFLHSVIGKEAVSNANLFEKKELLQENILGTVFDVNEKETLKKKPKKAEKEAESEEDSKIQIVY